MSDHEWCRDVRRDEAIRAAEDAAAVPSIQHRNLPEVVADLRERVARLEAAQATLGTGDEIARLTGGEQQPPRGWLTAEERAAVEEAMVDYGSNVGDSDCERIERVLRALLARSTPPRVKMPPASTGETPLVRDLMWGEAIRAAGGEVEE